MKALASSSPPPCHDSDSDSDQDHDQNDGPRWQHQVHSERSQATEHRQIFCSVRQSLIRVDASIGLTTIKAIMGYKDRISILAKMVQRTLFCRADGIQI